MRKLLTITILLISNLSFSQIKSVIIDSETKEKIPYVNIWVENENIGTTSNESGEFTLENLSGEFLILSSLVWVMKTKELKFQKYLTQEIAKRIKSNFKEENCISANNDKEAELNQIRLNTLEDENNPIRAVFAVQKLNEGWDVLNLFDIVRLYEGQNTGGSNTTIGKTTLSEAQLIGRGARYFPFALEEGQDKYKRKYDDDPSNDMKVLEELYYHTKEDNRYISELKKALVKSGIYEDEDKSVTKQLTLKFGFKETDFYKTGKIVFNKKVEKSYNNIKSFSDLGVSKRNFDYTLSSGIGKMSGFFTKEEENTKTYKIEQKDIPISEIPKHIIRFALSQNPFYYFDSLERYFPNSESINNFISSEDYLCFSPYKTRVIF